MQRKSDPDGACYEFWKRNKWCAPDHFEYEAGYVFYRYAYGHRPASAGMRVMACFERLWGPPIAPSGQAKYMEYMKDKMPNEHWAYLAYLENLTGAAQVYGDATFENMVLGEKKVYLIDPGYSRGLMCRELDLAKMHQSERGWDGIPKPLSKNINILILYLTHLYRLLRHEHPEWRLIHARTEIGVVSNAIENILN